MPSTLKKVKKSDSDKRPAKRPVNKSRAIAPKAPGVTQEKTRTSTKLVDAIQSEHDRLLGQLATLTAKQMAQPGVVAEWSVKDVLVHLTACETRLLQRVNGGSEWGADMKTSAFNELIYRQNRQRALDEVRLEFDDSYAHVLEHARTLTDSQVTNWWKAFAFNTHGHYRWANQQIRRWIMNG